MISSRQAAVLAASLLSVILLVPPATFADDKSNAGDSASDSDHNRKRHGNDGGERRGGDRQRGDQPNTNSQGAGFGREAPPSRNQGFGKNAQPNTPPSNTNKPAFTGQPQPPPAAKTQTPPANTFSKDNAPNNFRAGDRGKPDQKPFGNAGQRPDQKQFGNQGNSPRPGSATPPIKTMPDFGAASPDRGRLPKPPSAADAKKRFENLRKARTEKVEAGGNVVIREPGNRTIIKKNNRIMIQHDETERLKRVAPNARFEKGKNGMNVAVIDRPGNVKIYSETDANGRLLRRYRRGPDGRDVIIIDNRRGHGHGGSVGRDIAAGVGIGIGVVAGAAILNSMLDVPPPRVRIPRDRYIVDYERASEDDVYDALSAPPVDEYSDRYTLDEVRATASLRDRMRRVDLDDINFEFGSWEVDPSEYRKLDRVARAMMRVISRNPDEVFMIEGYTDAVGSQEDNLSLSDRRAESVAEVLTEEFNVPFENLITQGYGEDYLKVQTQAAERANRRVAVRRITPLLARGDGPPPRR